METDYPSDVLSLGYPGSKLGNSSYKQIINRLPPHQRFICGFLGTCYVTKNKVAAPVDTLAFELDTEVIKKYWTKEQLQKMRMKIQNQSFLDFLRAAAEAISPDVLIYADPPYLRSSRRNVRQLYLHEMTESEHVELLTLLLKCKCMVAISAYANDLYDTMLKGWRKETWQVGTRGGVATEALYMNYRTPTRLHQYNFLGMNRQKRQDFKRKQQRWLHKLQTMTDHERYGLMEAINNYYSSANKG